MIKAVDVTLDHWASLKTFILAQPCGVRKLLGLSEPDLKAAVINSLTPGTPFALKVLLDANRVIGYAVMVIHQNITNSVPQLHCYTHSICIDSSASPKAGFKLVKAIEDFARSRDAKLMYGHIRAQGPIEAWQRKYGYDVLYTAIGKRL